MEVKLYVGNLSYDTTEDDLRSMFAQVGTVNEVALIKDRDTGTSKGFAFVTMSSQDEAKQAIERFNGQTLSDRNLTVNIARPREDRPRSNYDSGRGGGYRGNTSNRSGNKGRRY
jgi:RNA recognition motif-containing protein